MTINLVTKRDDAMKYQYLDALPESMQSTAAIFAALGDPARQRILLLFEPGESLSIKEIADLFALSRTAVVHHLTVLERAGVLAQRREGKAALYSLRPEAVLDAVTALRDYILEEYPELASRRREQ